MPDKHAYSDDEIRSAFVAGQEPEPFAVKVVVADYDPSWPLLFEEEARKIRAALGTAVAGLEHVGSTSVPGLAAKPVLDIVLAVADSSAEESYVDALEGAGYLLVIREPDDHQHRCFMTRLDRGHRQDVNLHVYTAGCVEYERYLVFRDWLRGHDDDRDLYQRTKQELASKVWKYVQHYADAKTGVVREILSHAGDVSGGCVLY